MRMLRAIRRVNATTRPEESVPLRVAITASVMMGVLAVLSSGAAPVGDALAALVLLPVGAWVSWRRRTSDNIPIKIALTIGAALALWRFFGDLSGAVSLDDTRAPLAALFLAVQVLHGFDLPQRRDLGFTLASSLALVALAATTTHSGLFGLLLVAYVALAAVSLAGMQRSAARERADALRAETASRPLLGGDPEATGATAPRRTARTVASSPTIASLASSGPGLLRAAIPVMLVGAFVFMLLPRSGTAQIGTLPFRGIPSAALPNALINNPGLQGGGQQTPDERGGQPLQFDSSAYFGFAEYVDLRTSGELDDRPVLRVRADRPRFWRGMVFTTYDGTGWTRDSEEPAPTYGRPVRLKPDHLLLEDADQAGTTVFRWERREKVVQTVELIADTPNLVFAAGDPELVYVSGGSANQWPDGTISTGQLMEAGTIYSVVSRVELTDPATLRSRVGPPPAAVQATYTTLPASLPQRVRDLADEVTAGAATPYAKAEAIEGWLRDNVEYTLDAPPPPVDGDIVDHFLFETRQGWCEPIASSMVVMLRSQGVPARFATGFQPGRRNPISGVWDVAMSDAHAWVEVWIPETGWVTFDPTGAVPLAVSTESTSRLPLVQMLRWVTEGLAAVLPDGVRDVFRTLGERVREAPAATGAALAGLLALVGGAVALSGRRRRAAERADTPFALLTSLVAEAGIPRDGWQTPREYVDRVRLRRPDLPDAALATLLADEERRRYAQLDVLPPSPEAEAAVAAVRDALTAEARDEPTPVR